MNPDTIMGKAPLNGATSHAFASIQRAKARQRILKLRIPPKKGIRTPEPHRTQGEFSLNIINQGDSLQCHHNTWDHIKFSWNSRKDCPFCIDRYPFDCLEDETLLLTESQLMCRSHGLLKLYERRRRGMEEWRMYTPCPERNNTYEYVQSLIIHPLYRPLDKSDRHDTTPSECVVCMFHKLQYEEQEFSAIDTNLFDIAEIHPLLLCKETKDDSQEAERATIRPCREIHEAIRQIQGREFWSLEYNQAPEDQDTSVIAWRYQGSMDKIFQFRGRRERIQKRNATHMLLSRILSRAKGLSRHNVIQQATEFKLRLKNAWENANTEIRKEMDTHKSSNNEFLYFDASKRKNMFSREKDPRLRQALLEMYKLQSHWAQSVDNPWLPFEKSNHKYVARSDLLGPTRPPACNLITFPVVHQTFPLKLSYDQNYTTEILKEKIQATSQLARVIESSKLSEERSDIEKILATELHTPGGGLKQIRNELTPTTDQSKEDKWWTASQKMTDRDMILALCKMLKKSYEDQTQSEIRKKSRRFVSFQATQPQVYNISLKFSAVEWRDEDLAKISNYRRDKRLDIEKTQKVEEFNKATGRDITPEAQSLLFFTIPHFSLETNNYEILDEVTEFAHNLCTRRVDWHDLLKANIYVSDLAKWLSLAASITNIWPQTIVSSYFNPLPPWIREIIREVRNFHTYVTIRNDEDKSKGKTDQQAKTPGRYSIPHPIYHEDTQVSEAQRHHWPFYQLKDPKTIAAAILSQTGSPDEAKTLAYDLIATWSFQGVRVPYGHKLDIPRYIKQYQEEPDASSPPEA